MNKRLQVIKYIIADFLSALMAWTMFFIYRKTYIEPGDSHFSKELLADPKFFTGILILAGMLGFILCISGHLQ
jgi:hypothetical protein